jgi:hypothetical protein
MSYRSLQAIVLSGGQVSTRELFSALRSAGYEVIATAKPTQFKIRGGTSLVVIAVKGNDVLPVYLSRIARALGIREGGADEG